MVQYNGGFRTQLIVREIEESEKDAGGAQAEPLLASL